MANHEIARPFQRWIFICYAHRDKEWKERVHTFLKSLEVSCGAEIFCDTGIKTGDDWDDTISEHLQGANAGILLISADFLASTYIAEKELPVLLARAQEERGDLQVYPVLTGTCPVRQVTFRFITRDQRTERRSLARLMGVNDFGKPLNSLSEHESEVVLNELVEAVSSLFHNLDLPPAAPSAKHPNTTRIVNVARMPRGSSLFFGRDEELSRLNDCWSDNNTRVFTIVSQGGEGKSALVSHWLRRLERRDWDERPAFAWSFYSQGTSDDRVAADDFAYEALNHFGDLKPENGTPEDKGRRLAKHIIRTKGLLILDGLEPLQEGKQSQTGEEGRVKDATIASLLVTLAKAEEKSPGLCVVTTRQPVQILPSGEDDSRIKTLNLRPLKPKDSLWLLRLLGVKGNRAQLTKQSSDLANHPLTLLLYGTFVRDIGVDGRESPKHPAHAPKLAPKHCPSQLRLRLLQL